MQVVRGVTVMNAEFPNSLTRASAEKTKQCFFYFALNNLIGLVSLVFKLSSTNRETDLRNVGKRILFFNNFNSIFNEEFVQSEKNVD